MRRWLDPLNAALSRRTAGWWLLGAVAVAYVIAYRVHPLFPGHGAGALSRGWWGWSDQSRYLGEAAAIATLRLDSPTYQYPVGYPLLGALFWRWMPAHPFFVPNLLLILGSAAVWWRLGRRWLAPVEVLAVGIGFLLFHRWLVADTMVVPWNTLPTQLTLLTGVWLVFTSGGRRLVWTLALLAGAMYVTRPIDAVAFGPLLACAILRLSGWRQRLLHGIGGGLILVVAVGAVGGLNRAIFGTWQTPYEAASTTSIGFFSYPVSFKLFWLLVDGRPLFHETDPALLFRYPWLLLVVPAACYLVAREGRVAVAALGAVVVNWLLYLNYNDFLPSDVYRFTLIHYLAWSFPLLFLWVAVACRHGWRLRVVWVDGVGSAVLAILCAGLRMDERPLSTTPDGDQGWLLPSTRPLLIRYPGAARAASGQLRIDGQPLTEYSEYLMPYLGSDLQLLLSARRSGRLLSDAGGPMVLPPPEYAEYVWRWRPNPGRVKRLCQ